MNQLNVQHTINIYSMNQKVVKWICFAHHNYISTSLITTWQRSNRYFIIKLSDMSLFMETSFELSRQFALAILILAGWRLNLLHTALSFEQWWGFVHMWSFVVSFRDQCVLSPWQILRGQLVSSPDNINKYNLFCIRGANRIEQSIN